MCIMCNDTFQISFPQNADYVCLDSNLNTYYVSKKFRKRNLFYIPLLKLFLSHEFVVIKYYKYVKIN